jgi:hypothetical protein
MTEILAVFRSRTQAADFAEKLKNYNIKSQLINTPKEANVGCGLSVKFESDVFNLVKRVIANGKYTAFYGFFKYDKNYGKLIITPI